MSAFIQASASLAMAISPIEAPLSVLSKEIIAGGNGL